MRAGTIAHIACRDRFERQSGSKEQVVFCGEDGKWNPSIEVCTPICGETPPEGTPYIVNGSTTMIPNVPWHVGSSASVF